MSLAAAPGRIQNDPGVIDIINKDEDIKRTYDLITSVVGIGPITAIDTIVYTNNFQNFSKQRQYANFIGVAPFDYTSGTSVNGRTRVSQHTMLRTGSHQHRRCSKAGRPFRNSGPSPS